MTGPIFITGASRSGTELLRAVLNRHPEVHITGESHYFADPRARLADPARPTPREREALLDHFMRVSMHGYGLPISPTQGPGRARLEQAWAREGQGADALFTASCRANAALEGKVRWGEKTPRHLYCIDQILAAFPEAKIIVCQRDPRAAVISYRDWRNNWFDRSQLGASELAAVEQEERRARRSYNLTIASLLWRSAIEAGRAAQARHGTDKVRLHRYEDLVENPQSTVRAITDWLGLPFTNDVLNVNIVNSSYTKIANSRGIDPRVGSRWREKICKNEAAYIELLTSKHMQDSGYEREYGRPSARFLAIEIAKLAPATARIALANHARMGSPLKFISERMRSLVQSA
ncbi:sulfotransferase [Novosphingobium sp. YJ-S2-02]|uniref:Sulfotransferase n=1 Tax=Novosphingobium aureum TaxID=2792964 RepID=A0A931HD19_9SPHN|nr:sulfotransferase [Novosphingobium aureum]MBH0113835.1 sulfotransferase [Novosphingobium aureum]